MSATRGARRWMDDELLAAALLPPAAVLRQTLRYAKNVPLGDQWAGFAALVVKSYESGIGFADLWLQNNEHRVVVPNLVLLGIARLTSWNTRAEIAGSFAIALLAFGLLASLARRTVGRHAPGATGIVVLLTSLAQFSMAAQENWASGWQMTIHLNVLFAVAGAWSLDRFGATARGAAAAMAAALLAAFSFASGLFLLALVPLALVLWPVPPRLRSRLWAAAGAAAVGAIGARLYFVGYYTPLGRPTTSPLAQPVQTAWFVIAYVGALIGAVRPGEATAWGALGVVLLAAAGLRLWRGSAELRAAALPWLLLATYALLAGLSTAIGRLSGGIGNALVGRYISISALAWPAIAALVAMAVAEIARARGRRVALALRAGCGLALVAAAPYYAESYANGAGAYAARANQYQRGLDCVLDVGGSEEFCFRSICWDPALVKSVIPRLAAHRLGPFAGRPDAAPADGPSGSAP